MVEITNRYGVKIGKEIVPYGTNKIADARFRAKLWKGKVVDFAAVGKRYEKAGIPVKYAYRKAR